MNYEVPIKQSERPESEDSMVEIKKKNPMGHAEWQCGYSWRGKKEKGDRKWK